LLSARRPTPRVAIRSASLFLFPDNAIFTGEKLPGALADFCWPPHSSDDGSGFLEVYPDGGLDGSCKSESSDGLIHRTGKLSGQHDTLEDEVSFHLETTIVFGGVTTSVLKFDGKGHVNGTTASGTGNFVYTCNAAGEAVCLPERKSINLQGTMPFQIDFVKAAQDPEEPDPDSKSDP